MKKSIVITISLLLCSLAVFSKEETDSVVIFKPTSIYAWKIDEKLGIAYPTAVDTTITNFQNTTTDHIYSIANAYNGNIGSPLESKIYFERHQKSDFLFLKSYESYYKSVVDNDFYNTKTPYSNITYYRAGPSYGREERFNGTFSANVNQHLNIGFAADYIYGRGVYQNQSTNHILSRIFASYTGKRYEAHGVASLNNFKNYENGGITDPNFIRNPEENNVSSWRELEVNLPAKTVSSLRNRYVYYNHKYHLGFERTNEADTAKKTFVPVTTFTHTLKYEVNSKAYSEQEIPTDFYAKTFYNESATRDSVRYSSLKNTFAISLNEEFNRFARFGLTAFISDNYERFLDMNATYSDTLKTTSKNTISVGGVLAKHLGRKFHYDALGEISVAGYRLGEFKLLGNISNVFPIKKDSIILSAQGFIENSKPNHFAETYYSNHFIWNNNFDNEYKTHISGRITIPGWRTELNIGVENLSNYIYFNAEGPVQNSGSVQIVALNLKQDFALGPFRLENQVVYQETSDENVLPLPRLSLYHNLYFIKKLFQVLTVQLGVNLHYNTAYYAPVYMPAIGQFAVQQTEKVGNFPRFDVYGNFHLKRLRFFVMYYHLNYEMSSPNYFSMPNYPINPGMLKLGLSWNFYD